MNDDVEQSLSTTVHGLQRAFADDLVAVVLFGPAAEQRRRVVSDTNLAVVVKSFTVARSESAREVIALARIALRRRPLWPGDLITRRTRTLGWQRPPRFSAARTGAFPHADSAALLQRMFGLIGLMRTRAQN